MDRFEKVLGEARQYGLLLESDAKLKNVCGLILGTSIKGSWWGHPKGRDIWRITQQLADHPDIMVLKLVAGKVTYVHRRLWPAVYAVTRAHEPWQSHGLSSAARAILIRLRKDECIRTDQLPQNKNSWKEAARDLENRLLVFSQEVHTESGAHAKRLESWEHWARRLKIKELMTTARAKAQLEQATESLGAASAGLLPWASNNQQELS